MGFLRIDVFFKSASFMSVAKSLNIQRCNINNDTAETLNQNLERTIIYLKTTYHSIPKSRKFSLLGNGFKTRAGRNRVMLPE